MLEAIQDLPERYRIIDRITSVELKLNLAVKLGEIIQMLDGKTLFSPSAPLRKTISQYFSYLQRSCLDSRVLNSRARWLLPYTEVIHHKLQEEKQLAIRRSEPDQVEDHQFITSVITLINNVMEQRQLLVSDADHDNAITEVIDDIILLASYVAVDHSMAYQSLSTRVEQMITGIRQQKSCRVAGSNDQKMLDDLKSLRHQLRYVTLHPARVA